MSVALERGMAILELLSTDRNGLQLSQLSKTLDIPHSATHRLLECLMEMGYVHQTREMGEYCLSLKAVSLGIRLERSFSATLVHLRSTVI